MFQTLLIANRGEIACRIIRTASAMGIRTVAVYSDADAKALHVARADVAVRIGPASPRESYLNIAAILAAAKQSGADAIHPGYGFLSENAAFAEACAAAGIVFVGPPPSAIRAMGLKDRAKALMARAGVPIVPGYLGDDQAPEHLAREAGKIGYPVLIKAVAGGGGKGMRKVEVAGDFAAALDGARREAKSAFGDDKVLIEKYVARPRHIEVQVFADTHGNAVHLFERDCSLQRRHQKVIEEAPAPGMSAAMRAAIGEAAVKAARAVGYVGAGTIEFIADASDGLKPDRIWFMEMNTRLQVEHPVTEAITGTDLVEWQLRVAAGEKLPRTQDELAIAGHAIEVRLYAEDPHTGFLPSTGTLEVFHIDGRDVRIDTGVREGDVVTPFYDPMIAKVIAHGATREAAAARLAKALSQSFIAGVRTNNAFLIRALRHKDFLAGEVDTGFIARHGADLIPPATVPDDAYAMAADVLSRETWRPDGDSWDSHDSFRNSGKAAQFVDFAVDGKRRSVALPGLALRRNADVHRLANGDVAVMADGATWLLRPYDPFAAADAAGAKSDRIVTPMPGKIVQLLVQSGDAVKKGQPLAVLEAMKMEHTLSAPADATVESVGVAAGDQVPDGTIVVRFRKEEEDKAA
ncbi:MAG: biotin carboxylase N-terminal domain-containing protein [Rhizomicrobium sp.]